MIIAFTGHRPDKLGGYGSVTPQIEWVAANILAALHHMKPRLVLSGMAQGVDQIAVVVAESLAIDWAACVPFVGQESAWPPSAQKKYRALLSTAKRIIYTDNYASPSTQGDVYKCLQWRNEWMVDHADLLIAVWDGSKGGTANCVKYAKLMGKPIYRLDPLKRTRDRG